MWLIHYILYIFNEFSIIPSFMSKIYESIGVDRLMPKTFIQNDDEFLKT